MGARTSPTERQRRLGAELRKIRTSAGISAEAAAGLLGIDRGRVSHIELGVSAITPERLRTLACNSDCTDEAYINALVDMAQIGSNGWWEKYRGTLPQGLLDIAELEGNATRLHTAQTVHLPGLLHLSGYARAIFKLVIPQLPPSEVELRVAHRMERQQVLERDQPVDYVGYIHEAALRMQFGGRRTTREQLDHMCAMCERPGIRLRVLPVEGGSFPGAGHALLYAEGPVPQLDTVQLDSAHGPEFTYAEAQLAKYRAHLEWMDVHTLDPDRSRDFIHSIAREL
ncbi:helix-turn-helix domain-containing protein [Streptomyces beijiangensis]|uniref:Helix-turn-helix transcriptional regulator n=1 Tax=Streptomyces beijiangensis TaxID=163361 RepID=A0A939FCN1_9ACTN|nr:helix-turn-helix transcriptional regulator [Streptomyces beijiangensis]MBO0515879.1 helix-turn-helix transcriptional regulator [Streptomyces beijiangensis]